MTRFIAPALAILALAGPARATTFDLPSLGQFTINDTLISSGALDLTRFCATAGSCIDTGPWNEVSFTLTPWLDDLMEGRGAQVIDRLRLGFDASGGVNSGFWLSEGAGSPLLVAAGDNPFQGAIVSYGPDRVDTSMLSFAWNAQSDVPEPSTAMLAIMWIIGITAFRSLYFHQGKGATE